MSRLLRTAAATLITVVATLLLVELGTWALFEAGTIDTTVPRRIDSKSQFWKSGYPLLGVWHESNAEWVHESSCFKVTYTSNSVGARDIERSLSSDKPRVVVLGDSMFEGWGVTDDQRLTGLLEASTGIEHLNFAMAHFGPYQQLLAYRQIAKQFDHDAVIVSVFPHNDFFDLTLDFASWIEGLAPKDAEAWKQATEGYPYVYRPYLVKGDAGYSHRDRFEPVLRRVLRQYSYSFNAALDAYRAGKERWESRGSKPAKQPSSRVLSFFYDLREPHFEILEEVLNRFVEEVGNRKLIVVLIPSQSDIIRYQQTAGDRLYLEMTKLAKKRGFQVVNLLFGMGASSYEPQDPTAAPEYLQYYHSCDYHWSPAGHQKAHDLIVQQLSSTMYAELAGEKRMK